MDDRKILRLLLARAEEAIEAMAAKFGRRLTQTARHILGDWREAEESVSDTYLAVWNAVPEPPCPRRRSLISSWTGLSSSSSPPMRARPCSPAW